MNKLTKVLAGMALVAAAGGAWAAGASAVRLVPATIGAALQTALHERYGDAEGPVLQAAVAESLAQELRSAGATLNDSAALRIEVTIEDAAPTHPTRHQVEVNPSIDRLRSVSLGGARLHAVVRDADGKIVDHVDYDDYAVALDQVSPSGDAWADARVTIQRFCAQVARAWRRTAARS